MPESAERLAPLEPDRRRWSRALIALLPLLCVLGPYASFAPGASGFPYFYRLAALTLLLGSLALLRHHALRTAWAPMAFTALTVLWVVWTSLSLLWTPARGSGVVEVVASGTALVCAWVLMLASRGRADLLRLLREGWWAATAAVGVIALLEVVTGRHTAQVLAGREWLFRMRTVSATFVNPNGLGLFAAFGFLLAAASLVRGLSRRGQVLAALAVPVLGYLVLATGGRGGVYAFVAVGLGAGLLALPALHRSWIPYLLVAAAVALPLVAPTGVGEWRPPAAVRAIEKDPDTAKNPENKLDAPGASAEKKDAYQKAADKKADGVRVRYTEMGLSYLEQRPLVGHGAGAAMELMRRDPRLGKLPVVPLHNSLLQVSVNYGLLLSVPVVLTVLVLLGCLLWGLRLRDREDLATRLEGAGAIGVVMVASIGLSSIYNEPVFLGMLGYAAACAWVVAHRTRAARRARADAEVAA